MRALEQFKCAAVALLLFVFVQGGCTRGAQQSRSVETAGQAGQIAARYLFSLGQDTSFCTVEVRPDHPISWDTIKTGNRYAGLPVEDSSSFGRLIQARLSDRVFWQCLALDRIPYARGSSLVTDAIQAQVYIEASTGAVLLTLPQDLYRSKGSAH